MSSFIQLQDDASCPIMMWNSCSSCDEMFFPKIMSSQPDEILLKNILLKNNELGNQGSNYSWYVFGNFFIRGFKLCNIVLVKSREGPLCSCFYVTMEQIALMIYL